jgi:hypothetical protein
MTAKELYEYLGKQIEAQSKFGDLEVVVVTTGNYLNVRSYTKVTNVSKGMYWEIGRLNITTKEAVSKVYVANPINETPIELKSLRNPKNPE